jgi:acetoin utilization deacetylase AcuC-like enzyme
MLRYCEPGHGWPGIPWIYDRAGRRRPALEKPVRAQAVIAGLRRAGVAAIRPEPPPPARLASLLSAVHGQEFLAYLRRGGLATREQRRPDGEQRPPHGEPGPLPSRFAAPGLSQDTPLVRGTWEAAGAAAAMAATAAEYAAAHGHHVYAPCRPPGHHAGPDWHGGYCFLNNAMVAAVALRDAGVAAIAIIDLDYHLGNGTLACASRGRDIHYLSIHSTHPADFPYDFPQADGLIGVSEPVDDIQYLALLHDLVERALEKRPEMVVVSAGFDTLAGDPYGSWKLSPRGWHDIGRCLVGLGVPMVVVQEGGYVPQAVEESAMWLAKGLMTNGT